jgi:pyruvate/2-oxoglutarate dehydrogenase complex dihydrolipoamide acyltransferase (E2) component
MDKVVTMPDLGDTAQEAEISQWLVKVGDSVEKGAPLVEVLVDKASMELAAEFGGRVKELLQEEGSIVSVGEDIAVMEV